MNTLPGDPYVPSVLGVPAVRLCCFAKMLVARHSTRPPKPRNLHFSAASDSPGRLAIPQLLDC